MLECELEMSMVIVDGAVGLPFLRLTTRFILCHNVRTKNSGERAPVSNRLPSQNFGNTTVGKQKIVLTPSYHRQIYLTH